MDTNDVWSFHNYISPHHCTSIEKQYFKYLFQAHSKKIFIQTKEYNAISSWNYSDVPGQQTLPVTTKKSTKSVQSTKSIRTHLVINKAEILSTNRANERPHEGTLYDLITEVKTFIGCIYLRIRSTKWVRIDLVD